MYALSIIIFAHQHKQMNNRLLSLDYLRGLAALGIMVFHFGMWRFGFFKAGDFLGKVGIYGVSVFYVLSGLTLFHVYYDKIGKPSGAGLTDFFIKRLFRIFPLLWLLSIITLLIGGTDETSLQTIVLNFTGLFGLVHWDKYVCYGAWSIGNELVFYLFFPVLIFLSKQSKISLFMFVAALLAIYAWFAFVYTGNKTIFEFWVSYINPLNQVFLFAGGFCIGLLTRNITLPRAVGISLAAFSFAAFICYPVGDETIFLISGWNRMAFTAMCFVLGFSFYKTDFALPRPIARAFHILGEISYSLYLVHPIVWHVLWHLLRPQFRPLPPWVQLSIGFALSFGCAYLLYNIYERYFMKLGQRVAKKLSARAERIA